MTISNAARVSFGIALILCGAVAIVAFGVWQSALSGLSPDGAVTNYSWLILRVMLISLGALGLAMLNAHALSRLLAKIDAGLQGLSQSRFLVCTLGCGAVLRLAVIALLPTRLISDFASYDELAMLWITHGEYTDGTHPTAYFPPGWPFVLSLLYRVFGHHVVLGLLANVVFGIATIWLSWILVRRIWGESEARWTALVLAALPSEVLFTNVLASEGLFTALLCLLLVLLTPDMKSPRIAITQVLAGGIVLGLATLTRSLAALLPTVIGLGFIVRYGKTWRAAALALACTAGLLLVITPWIMRNAERVGRATVCTNTGANFHIGNNPNSGVGYNDPDRSVLRLRSAADEAHDDSAGMAAGIEYIRERPLAFLVRGALKTVFFLTNDTDAIASDLAAAADAGRQDMYVLLALLTQSAWMLFVLAGGFGVWWFLRASPWNNPGGIVVLGVIVYWVAVHFAFYAGSRYHMPIIPALSAFAGIAIAKFAAKAKTAWR